MDNNFVELKTFKMILKKCRWVSGQNVGNGDQRDTFVAYVTTDRSTFYLKDLANQLIDFFIDNLSHYLQWSIEIVRTIALMHDVMYWLRWMKLEYTNYVNGEHIAIALIIKVLDLHGKLLKHAFYRQSNTIQIKRCMYLVCIISMANGIDISMYIQLNESIRT